MEIPSSHGCQDYFGSISTWTSYLNLGSKRWKTAQKDSKSSRNVSIWLLKIPELFTSGTALQDCISCNVLWFTLRQHINTKSLKCKTVCFATLGAFHRVIVVSRENMLVKRIFSNWFAFTKKISDPQRNILLLTRSLQKSSKCRFSSVAEWAAFPLTWWFSVGCT